MCNSCIVLFPDIIADTLSCTHTLRTMCIYLTEWKKHFCYVAGATRWHDKLTLQNHAPCLTVTLWVPGQTLIIVNSSWYWQLASFKCHLYTKRVSAQLYCTFQSVHDGNHYSLVRIFIGLSCDLWDFINCIICYTKSVISIHKAAYFVK